MVDGGVEGEVVATTKEAQPGHVQKLVKKVALWLGLGKQLLTGWLHVK